MAPAGQKRGRVKGPNPLSVRKKKKGAETGEKREEKSREVEEAAAAGEKKKKRRKRAKGVVKQVREELAAEDRALAARTEDPSDSGDESA
jgi:U3 small nucleolar RNA-associated protein 23